MKASLAYIDDMLDWAVKREHEAPKLSQADRKAAASGAMKVVAGFHLKDEEAERKALDAAIEGRRAKVAKFIEDRAAVREKLDKLGITPLAVVPTSAWDSICKSTGLFLLWTDPDGRVAVSREAFRGCKNEAEFAWVYRNHRADTLAKLFPNQTIARENAIHATLVMPQPPADVAAILLKAATLSLKVATVAEAIGFKETPEQLYRSELARREEEARALAMRNDPIVYHEHETAAAIIAQFGDFPIEKAIVDGVAASDRIVPDAPSKIDPIVYVDTTDLYRRALISHQEQMNRARQQAEHAQWLGAQNVAALGLQPAQFIDSGRWTGR